jgi:ribose-phosphate pyrophosphokinase
MLQNGLQRDIPVIPYFGWARQDRKDKPKSSDRSKINSKLIETAGATRMKQWLYDQIKDSLKNQLITFLFDYLLTLCKSLGLDNLTIASPDMGGSKRCLF